MTEPKVLRVDWPYTGAGPSPEADATSKRLFEATSQSIVKTETESSLGTGFAVGPNRFITDAHCVLGDNEIKIVALDGTKYRAKIVDLDDINDLALLEIVSNKSVNFKPMALGSSNQLRQDEHIFALGHPQGSPDVFISPGYFKERLTQQAFFNHASTPQASDPLFYKLTAKELPDLTQFRNRSLLSGRVHIEHGNSGGPLIDARARVVGVSDLGASETDKSDTYYTPVEQVKGLVGRSSPKFKFKEEWQPAPWINDYKTAWHQSPGDVTALTGAGSYAAYKLRNVKGKAEVGTVLGGSLLVNDASELYYSNHIRDKARYGAATAGDAMMLAGGGLNLLSTFGRPQNLIGKISPYGTWIAGGGFALRLGSEFIPNRLTITDLSRTDGDLRAPFRIDMSNLTPRSAFEIGSGGK